MGLPKLSLTTQHHLPDFIKPESIFDLVNFTLAELVGVSASLVTRICESNYGITREEWQFIAMLAAIGSLTPSNLAKRTTVDRSQTSKTLQALVEKKLVTRQRMQGDGRSVTLQLTEDGRQLYEQLFPEVTGLHHELLAGLKLDEKEMLMRLLLKLQLNAFSTATLHWPETSTSRRQGGSRIRWQKTSDKES